MWYGEIWSEADMTQLSLMLYFSKTARNFLTILSLNIDIIPFQMSLSSHLAALVWQTGVHTNVARNKDVIWRNLVRSWHDTTKFDVIFFKNGSKFFHNTFAEHSRYYSLSNEPRQPFSRAGLTDWRSYKLSLMLYFSKTARNFFTILSLNIVDIVPFQMSLDSHLAALVWQSGVHTNVARNKDVIWRNFFRNTFAEHSRYYSLSNEPGQPFSRAGLTDWRSCKRSEK